MRTRTLIEAEILDPDADHHVDYTDGTYEDWDGKYIPLVAYVRVVDQPFGNSYIDWTDEIWPQTQDVGATAIHVLAEYKGGRHALRPGNQANFDFNETEVRITCKPGTAGEVAKVLIGNIAVYGIGDAPDEFDEDEEDEPTTIETWDDVIEHISEVSLWYTDEAGNDVGGGNWQNQLENAPANAVHVHFWHG